MHNGGVKNRLPLLTIGLCLTCIGIWLAAPIDSALFDLLVLDRSEGSQLWRVASSHSVHTSLSHLAWNVAALALLGAAIELQSPARLVQSLCAGSLAVSAWFFWQDDFTRYAGASGVLNTLLIAGLYCQRQRLSNKIALLIALIALIKVIIELMTTSTLTALTSDPVPGVTWPSATGAHAAGYAAGVALALCWLGGETLDNQSPRGTTDA